MAQKICTSHNYDRRPIAGWENYEIDTDGVVYSRTTDAPLALIPSSNGYARVELWRKNRRKRLPVHRLVLETFVRKREAHEQCRHLNGDKLDNRLENLCWGTAYENHLDQVAHGTFTLPETANHADLRKLTDEQVREVRSGELGYKRLARKFGVCVQVIRRCRLRLTYKDVE